MVESKAHFWLRDEDRATERRTALTPKNARTLVENGFSVTVEMSDKRAFANGEYEAAGCLLAEPRSWPDAPKDTVILGLKGTGRRARQPAPPHDSFRSYLQGSERVAGRNDPFPQGGRPAL